MILVTGGTGKVGSEVVRLLADAGEPVCVLARDSRRAVGIMRPGVDIVPGDLGSAASLDEACVGVDRVFLLSPADPRQVEWESNVIGAATRAGVRHLVKISAIGAAKNSPVAIARWHWAVEQELETSGLPYTILQPHSFMQNLLGSATTVMEQSAIYAPAGDGRIGMVDARDIAAVAARVLMAPEEHRGHTYLVTGPAAVSYADVAATLSKVLGRPVRYVDVAPADAKQAMLVMGMSEWLADDLLTLFAIGRAGGGAVVTDLVPRVTGRPARGLEEFVRDHGQAFGAT